MRKLIVDAGGRYLSWDDGSPFFYMGDTAWELFHCLIPGGGRVLSLHPGATQGFTAIQAVGIGRILTATPAQCLWPDAAGKP